jgi:hypothetical protein
LKKNSIYQLSFLLYFVLLFALETGIISMCN